MLDKLAIILFHCKGNDINEDGFDIVDKKLPDTHDHNHLNNMKSELDCMRQFTNF